MNPQHRVAAYQSNQVLNSSPAKLVQMAYERTLSSLREAVAAIERGDIEARWRANKRAIEILGHLWETLDHDRGGEIAANLGELYGFILGRLVNVDLKNDPAPAREAIELLTPLCDSWRELAAAPQSTAATGQQASAHADVPLRASLSA